MSWKIRVFPVGAGAGGTGDRAAGSGFPATRVQPVHFFFGVISAPGALNFAAICDPSQKGLFFDAPQRQR